MLKKYVNFLKKKNNKKLMSKFKNFIILIDIFGHYPSFVIQNKLLHKTIFGGIITIFVIFISIISTIFFSQELLFRKCPYINLSTEIYNNPKRINYYNNFEFAIGIKNPNNNLFEINESIYYIKAFLIKTIINSTGTYNIKENINMKSCNEIFNESNINYNLFKNLSLDNLYCISNEQNNINDIYINEYNGNNYFQRIEILLYECTNLTNNNCSSENEINNFLNTTLSYYIINNNIRTNNHKNPFQRIINEYNYYLSNKLFISLNQNIHHLEIETDDGFMFTTYNKISSFKSEKIIKDVRLKDNNEKNFISFSFQLNNNIEKYYRKYYKIQDLAAQVGGIYNTIFLFCLLFLRMYEDNSYFEYLINKFFEVRFEDTLQNQKLDQNKRKKTFSRAIVQKEIKNISYNNKNKKKKENILLLNFFDKLIFINCCSKFSKAKKIKTDQIFFKGKKHIMNYLNITTYIKKTHSDDMRSDLMLDESQKKIFDYVFKPIISSSYLGTRYLISELPIGIKDRLIGNQKNENEQIMKKINEKIPSQEKNNIKQIIQHDISNAENISSENESLESKF